MAEGREDWVRVPVGDGARRWASRGRCRRVLFVVHNVTSATRLLDVMPLFDDDLRVQMLATCTGSSPFQGGVGELLAEVGVPVLPWEQAVRTPVDLAVSASLGGHISALRGKLAVLSHGVGYTKRLRSPVAGRRSPVAGRRAPVFGLAPEWLLDEDGQPVADALVLSHPEQAERLRESCPEAAGTAVLAGDPCFDRMLAARGHRDRFRRALGVREGQRLVVLSATWNPEGLFGDGGADDALAALLPRLTGELAADEYRVVAVLHPNIWQGHGPGQVRAWLDGARRGGLGLVDPLGAWRQALLAADAVIGDHGAVTYYAAALGVPVVLAAAPLAHVDPRAPLAAFLSESPRLDPYAPLPEQLDALLAGHRPQPGPARFTTSLPGESARRLRTLFYGYLGLPEPERPALLEPLPLPAYEPVRRSAPMRVLTRLGGADGGDGGAEGAGGAGAYTVVLRRWADPAYEPAGDGAVHTAVPEDTRDPGRLDFADVILRHGTPDDPRFGSPAAWCAETLRRYAHCALAAYVTGPGDCTVRTRDGDALTLSAAPAAPDAPAADPAAGADPAAYASAAHAWLAAGRTAAELAAHGLLVRTGAREHRVLVTRLPA
ncbi:hypothetical protein [Streptomyces sp. MAR4 CNX-425]|uniref:hypothetical protein n=1 Tax=Streptomyces sp. MAR4 CNX-425 TaxID=3406343 RepID=UPI003B50EEAE